MATYDTSYYDKAYEEYEKKRLTSAETQKTDTEADYNNRLKQAYINNRQTEKATNEALTQAGIRGGMTETSALKNALAYQNTRTGLQSERAKAIREIDTNAENDILAYKQTNDAAKNAYIEGREAEDREVQRQAEADQKAANTQLWTATYGGYTDVAELEALIPTITDPTEKAIAMARVNYLNEENTNKANTENTAYLQSKYGGITDLNTLNTALKNAKTTEEKTIIQNQINAVKESNNSQKTERYTAYYSKFYSVDKLKAELKKTKDPVIRTVINNRIGYLMAEKKGY